MASCERVRAQLKAYLDGECGGFAARRISRHLVGCAACRDESAVLLQIGSELRGMEQSAPPASLRSRILDALPADPQPLRASTRPRSLQWSMGLTAVAAAALVVGFLRMPAPRTGAGAGAPSLAGRMVAKAERQDFGPRMGGGASLPSGGAPGAIMGPAAPDPASMTPLLKAAPGATMQAFRPGAVPLPPGAMGLRPIVPPGAEGAAGVVPGQAPATPAAEAEATSETRAAPPAGVNAPGSAGSYLNRASGRLPDAGRAQTGDAALAPVRITHSPAAFAAAPPAAAKSAASNVGAADAYRPPVQGVSGAPRLAAADRAASASGQGASGFAAVAGEPQRGYGGGGLGGRATAPRAVAGERGALGQAQQASGFGGAGSAGGAGGYGGDAARRDAGAQGVAQQSVRSGADQRTAEALRQQADGREPVTALEVRVRDGNAAVTRVRALAQDLGGQVLRRRRHWDDAGLRVLTLTVRVPATRTSALAEQVSALAEVGAQAASSAIGLRKDAAAGAPQQARARSAVIGGAASQRGAAADAAPVTVTVVLHESMRR